MAHAGQGGEEADRVHLGNCVQRVLFELVPLKVKLFLLRFLGFEHPNDNGYYLREWWYQKQFVPGVVVSSPITIMWSAQAVAYPPRTGACT